MSHPDPNISGDHRSATDQSAPKPNASESLGDDLADPSLKKDADGGSDVRAEQPEDADRQGEAGNAYVGREMSDALKSSPRIEDADEVQEE